MSKQYPGAALPAVDRLTLDVRRGEFVTLVGPSGCGKTTTLKMINRIIEPTGGSIFVDGVDALSVPAHQLRRSIGYVIQQVGLFPHRTIAQNIGTVPGLLGWDSTRTRDRIAELIDVVGLEPEMLDRYPAELSGGQQQRVGVARALAADPPVLLMDEPFGAVDPIVRGRLQAEFKELQSRLGKTVVFVTHDIDEALFLGDRVVILNVGGKVEQSDTPAEILSVPRNRFVEEFLGGERGLKRLALLPVGGLGLEGGPMLDRSATASEARAIMARYDVDWFGVLDGRTLLGWASESDLDGEVVSDVELREFESTVSTTSSLREALDVVVTGHNRLALVVDDGVYMGVLDVEAIAREITG